MRGGEGNTQRLAVLNELTEKINSEARESKGFYISLLKKEV